MFRKKVDPIALVTQIASEEKETLKSNGYDFNLFPDALFRCMISRVLNYFRDDKIVTLNKSERTVIITLDDALSDKNMHFGSLFKLVKKCIFSIKPDGLGWWNIFNSDVGYLAKTLNNVCCYYRFEPEQVCDVILKSMSNRELLLTTLVSIKNDADKAEIKKEEQLFNYVKKTGNNIRDKNNSKKGTTSSIFSAYKDKSSEEADQNKVEKPLQTNNKVIEEHIPGASISHSSLKVTV